MSGERKSESMSIFLVFLTEFTHFSEFEGKRVQKHIFHMFGNGKFPEISSIEILNRLKQTHRFWKNLLDLFSRKWLAKSLS
eukprot:TRINITY_DN2529_c2_g1_i1.p1 TRINITY_DN2529_c2_g1~~TRINITY_DN2529_c2_g1_i1.p1  ORF type:complete len:81 (+),score=12.96 TRINITY_DN2529_c2_g1_i1:245-487(+)